MLRHRKRILSTESRKHSGYVLREPAPHRVQWGRNIQKERLKRDVCKCVDVESAKGAVSQPDRAIIFEVVYRFERFINSSIVVCEW